MALEDRLALCRYYEEKGFTVICMSRLLNLLALGFTIAFSAFLLLFVKWRALKSPCIQDDTCDISDVRTTPEVAWPGVPSRMST